MGLCAVSSGSDFSLDPLSLRKGVKIHNVPSPSIFLESHFLAQFQKLWSGSVCDYGAIYVFSPLVYFVCCTV